MLNKLVPGSDANKLIRGMEKEE